MLQFVFRTTECGILFVNIQLYYFFSSYFSCVFYFYSNSNRIRIFGRSHIGFDIRIAKSGITQPKSEREIRFNFLFVVIAVANKNAFTVISNTIF